MRFLVNRALGAIVTFFVISIVAFVLIQLPPGDYATTYIAKLEALGERPDSEMIKNIREVYGLDKPLPQRYMRWIGNFLRGDWGYSFQTSQPVRQMIFERLPLTISVDFVTLLFVWMVSVPIAIYSAVRQYSLADHAATVIAFLGLAVPNFLIALSIMWFSYVLFGTTVSGINSQAYVDQPMSLGKLIDSATHLWVILIVNGMAALAGYIRILRANLLDELNQPYVETARSMGLSEIKMLIKYPLRMALNPMISNIGMVLPQLISSSTITAIVLSIPTTAPMLYQALLSQDIYLAGGVIMLLGIMIIIGTLISDILLYLVDPRVRFSAIN
jgi:peptide/nickel transport system permease protein